MIQQLITLTSWKRWTLIFLLALCVGWIGFQRESKLLILENGKPTFIHRYPKPTVAAFEKTAMQGTWGIKLPAKLQSAILFSVIFMVMAALILMVYARSIFIGKMILILYSGYMVVAMALLQLGKLGVDYRLSTGLSHYMEDIFLSPLLILALAAFISTVEKMK